jgi:zinc transport system permease protein
MIAGFDWWAGSALPALHHALGHLPFDWAQYPFMRNALIECILLAPMCAIMGVKVVNFRMAFFSDAISHSAFAGVAVGFLLNAAIGRFDPRIALIVFGVLVGIGVVFIRRRTSLSNDTVIGVFFSTMVAFGIAVMTTGGRGSQFQQYLYGDILLLDAADIGITALLALLVTGFMLVSFNALTMVGLNAEMAHSRGLSVRAYEYDFAVLLALVVTISIRTAGILLVTAMLIVPAAAARNLARSMGEMFRWAVAISLISGIAGVILSYHAAISTGAAIILISAVFFAASFVAARR